MKRKRNEHRCISFQRQRYSKNLSFGIFILIFPVYDFPIRCSNKISKNYQICSNNERSNFHQTKPKSLKHCDICSRLACVIRIAISLWKWLDGFSLSLLFIVWPKIRPSEIVSVFRKRYRFSIFFRMNKRTTKWAKERNSLKMMCN